MDKVLEEKEDRKKYSKFFSALLIIIIPMLFAITVTLIVMTISGYNVFELTKGFAEKLPFSSPMKEEKQLQSLEQFESKINKLKADIKDRDGKILLLEAQLDSKDQQINEAMMEKEELEQKLSELAAMKEDNKRAFKDLVKTYEAISAKKAAPILSEMEEPEALMILSNIKADTLAGIMENMDPKDAAKYTNLLTAEKKEDLN